MFHDADETSKIIVATYYVGMLLITVLAMTITTFRWITTPEYRIGFGLLVIGGIAVVSILPAIQQSREAARRIGCKNNLKQIYLAMSNYLDTHQRLPYAGQVTDDGQICGSWRTSILPYVDAAPWNDLYHFNQPWNSPFNRLVYNRCPPMYHCLSHTAEPRYTDYAMLCGPGTVGGNGMTQLDFGDITDGKSNTLLVVEACGTQIIWTQPKDVDVANASLGINLPGNQPGQSRAVVSSYHVGGAHVVLCDGTVRYVSNNIDKKLLKSLTTIQGNDAVPAEW